MTNSPAEKIYLTYKTRMTTEARLRRAALRYHLMLSWYSFCLIVVSIIDASGKFEVAYSGIVSVGVAVLIFGLSLFLYGERYNERADQIKACYLELKKLYESSLAIAPKMKKYAEILGKYENQSDTDYDEMVFDAWLRGQTLQNAQGPIELSRSVFAKILVWRAVKGLGLAFMFALPVIAGLFWIRPIGR